MHLDATVIQTISSLESDAIGCKITAPGGAMPRIDANRPYKVASFTRQRGYLPLDAPGSLP